MICLYWCKKNLLDIYVKLQSKIIERNVQRVLSGSMLHDLTGLPLRMSRWIFFAQILFSRHLVRSVKTLCDILWKKVALASARNNFYQHSNFPNFTILLADRHGNGHGHGHGYRHRHRLIEKATILYYNLLDSFTQRIKLLNIIWRKNFQQDISEGRPINLYCLWPC